MYDIEQNNMMGLTLEDNRIYIVGAHSRAQTFAVYLQYIYSNIEIEAYLYDNEELNPDKIGTVPVLRLDQNTLLNTEYPVYIGTRGVYHEKFIKLMEKLGFKKIYPVTFEVDLKLRNEYLRKYFSDIKTVFIKIEDLNLDGFNGKKKASRTVYVVKSIFDKSLEQEYILAPYEKEIQVGAALTDKRLYPGILTDDIGANISRKNKQYCELTALYWIWKHSQEDMVGLVHYRRHFILSENWIEIMQKHDVDVILPTPLYVSPSLEENYKKRHDPSDWEFLMRYLRKKDESLYREAKSFFAGNLYSPCNMFIMKRNVLNDYCSWLFPILDAVAKHGGQKETMYLNRYPGFIAERLLTFYFGRKRDKYKVVYADKNFLP